MPWLLEMTILVSALMLPAVGYLVWRLFVTSQEIFSGTAWSKFILPLVLFSFYLFPVSGAIDFYISGNIEVLKYPKPLVYWFWFGLVFVFQLATWVLVADFIKLFAYFLADDTHVVNRWHARILITLFAVVFVLMGWKIYRDTTTVTTENITVPVDDLPPSLQDFKLVHITDIQGDEYTGRDEIARYIQKVNEQNPDLIVFTGDLISYGTDFIDMSARELGKAKAEYGTIAVVGDHDYWAGIENVKPALTDENIPLLQDENKRVELESSTSAVITGITEVYSKDSDPAIVDSLTTATKDVALKIFASHQVEKHLVTSAQSNSYDLMLAGHTHGGQIRVPFMGMSFSASERETPYINGLYWEGNLPIYVNNGLGFTLGPIRYNAPPEVTVIRFTEE